MQRSRVLIFAMFIVALFGAADAGYLTYEHYTRGTPPCSVASGCETVLTSRFATVAGIPVALFGLLFYVTVTLLAAHALAARGGRPTRVLLLVAPLGFAASLYFVSLQLFVLKATCMFCMVSAVSSALLLVCTLLLLHRRNPERTPPSVTGGIAAH